MKMQESGSSLVSPLWHFFSLFWSWSAVASNGKVDFRSSKAINHLVADETSELFRRRRTLPIDVAAAVLIPNSPSLSNEPQLLHHQEHQPHLHESKLHLVSKRNKNYQVGKWTFTVSFLARDELTYGVVPESAVPVASDSPSSALSDEEGIGRVNILNTNVVRPTDFDPKSSSSSSSSSSDSE